jgi:mRNA interferase MazF
MRGPRHPLRGEIWWAHLPTDPPDKGRRPVVIVSLDARNGNERATTVLVVPLSTSIHKGGTSQLLLRSGETGLPADSAAQAGNIQTLLRADLREPSPGQRSLSNASVCKLAELVKVAMGCPS